MNLTEVLLAVIISMAVIAGSYFLYTTVTEKNAMSTTMVNISLLRANIEDIYDGAYDDDSFGDIDTMVDLGIIPQYFLSSSGSGDNATTTLKTKWGDMTIAEGDASTEYTISMDQLSGDACVHFARFQVRSWKSIDVNDTEVWNRGTDTQASISEVATACAGGNATVTFTAP